MNDTDRDAAIQLLLKTISAATGRQAALQATLLGLLRSSRIDDATRASIEAELERAHAIHLGESLNPMFFDGFDEVRELALGALSEPKGD